MEEVKTLFDTNPIETYFGKRPREDADVHLPKHKVQCHRSTTRIGFENYRESVLSLLHGQRGRTGCHSFLIKMDNLAYVLQLIWYQYLAHAKSAMVLVFNTESEIRDSHTFDFIQNTLRDANYSIFPVTENTCLQTSLHNKPQLVIYSGGLLHTSIGKKYPSNAEKFPDRSYSSKWCLSRSRTVTGSRLLKTDMHTGDSVYVLEPCTMQYKVWLDLAEGGYNAITNSIFSLGKTKGGTIFLFDADKNTLTTVEEFRIHGGVDWDHNPNPNWDHKVVFGTGTALIEFPSSEDKLYFSEPYFPEAIGAVTVRFLNEKFVSNLIHRGEPLLTVTKSGIAIFCIIKDEDKETWRTINAQDWRTAIGQVYFVFRNIRHENWKKTECVVGPFMVCPDGPIPRSVSISTPVVEACVPGIEIYNGRLCVPEFITVGHKRCLVLLWKTNVSATFLTARASDNENVFGAVMHIETTWVPRTHVMDELVVTVLDETHGIIALSEVSRKKPTHCECDYPGLQVANITVLDLDKAKFVMNVTQTVTKASEHSAYVTRVTRADRSFTVFTDVHRIRKIQSLVENTWE